MHLFLGAYTENQFPGLFHFSIEKNETVRFHQSLPVPSAIAMCANQGGTRLYVVSCESESVQGCGSVYAFDISSERPILLSCRDTGGGEPCYVCLSPDERALYTANYENGTISVFSLGEKGEILPAVQTVRHQGKGQDPLRQESAHVHQVFFLKGEKDVLCAVDLGLDQLVFYRQESDFILTRVGTCTLPAGSGPRHILEYNENVFYAVCELSNQLLVFHRKGLDISLQSSFPLVCDGEGKPGYAAALKMNEKRDKLFVSCRNTDTLSVFAIDENGYLTREKVYPLSVPWPRDFALLDDKHILLCSQKGKSVLTRLHENDLETVYTFEQDTIVWAQTVPTKENISKNKGEK